MRMRHAAKNSFLAGLVVVCGILFFACRTTTLPPPSEFRDDWTGLFLSVTKSFGVVRTYYVGSDDRWSYFDCRGDSPRYRKTETSRMRLRRTFPFRQGTPYLLELVDFGYEKDGSHH